MGKKRKKSRKKKEIEKRRQEKKLRRAKKRKTPKSSKKQLVQKREELHDDRILDISAKSNMSMNKLSEAIIDFAYPLLERCSTQEEEKKILEIAILVWNINNFPGKEAGSFLEEMRRTIVKSDDPQEMADFDEVIGYLISRKKEYFHHDKRFVLDYTITYHGDQLHLQVLSPGGG